MNFSKYKKELFNLLSVVIVAVAIIVAALAISRTNFYIRDSGSSVSKSGEIVNVIEVSGDGIVYATPDMAIITVNVTKNASSSTEAISQSNELISKAKEIALENGAQNRDLKTTSFNINPRRANSGDKIVSYDASQSLEIRLRNITSDAKEVSNMLDELSKVEGIGFNRISFDIEDKTELFIKARELAYEKAEQKATELAKLGNLELLEPVSIQDTIRDFNSYQSNVMLEQSRSAQDFSGSEISTGEASVSVQLHIKFGIVPK